MTPAGRIALAMLATFGLGSLACAEIEKIANPCEDRLCFYWWPKLPGVKGWHYEKQVSLEQGINAFAPDGSTFEDAVTVMYASAVYKAGSDLQSLDAFIEADKKGFLQHSPGSTVAEVESLTTGDGKKLRTFTFFPADAGNWEHVAFGEEGDFYLVFTVSSRTKAGYVRTLPVFRKMVRAYKEKY